MNLTNQFEKIMSIDSCPGVGTRFVVDYIEDYALEHGLNVERKNYIIDGVEESNVLVYLGERCESEVLFWYALDTPDPGVYSCWKETDQNPYRATIKSDQIFGLGSASGKLDFLVALNALSSFKASNWKYSPVIVGSFGANNNFVGSRAFLADYKKNILGIIINESSNLKLVHRYSGSVVANLKILFSNAEKKSRQRFFEDEVTSTQTKIFRGTAYHSSYNKREGSAFYKALRYLEQIPSNVSVLNLESGLSPYITPSEAILEMDIAPSQTFDLKDKLLKLVSKIDTVFKDRFSKYSRRYDIKGLPLYNLGYVRTTSEGLEIEGCFYLTEGITKDRVKEWLCKLQEDSIEVELKNFKAPASIQLEDKFVSACLESFKNLDINLDASLHHRISDASLFLQKGIACLGFGSACEEGRAVLSNEFNSLYQLNQADKTLRGLIKDLCL